MRKSGTPRLASAFVVLVFGVSAWAQDYTVTNGTGLIETRPAGATQLTVITSTQSVAESAVVNLPFAFQYYGRQCTTLAVSSGGWVVPGAAAPFGNARAPAAAHGQDATSGAFPYGTGGGLNNADGVVAPLWTSLNVNDGQFETNPGQLYTWTTGTTPNRHFVVSWDNVSVHFSTNPRTTIQCQLFETSGRIVFAYSNTAASAYASTTYVCGLDSPNDLRFTAPLVPGSNNSGYPGGDFIFDPLVATFTGTLLYDRIVSDAFGIGTSVESNLPIPRCRVELQRNDGLTYVSTATAADGSFSMTDTGLPSATPGQVVVYGDNAACRVIPSTGGVHSWAAITSLSLANTGSNTGTRSLGTSGDSNGDVRSALHIARRCLAAYDWVSSHSSATIPKIDIYLDPTTSSATNYQKPVSPNPSYLRIGSRSAPNPDTWDDAIITKTYGRHVLASIAGVPTTNYDDQFDVVTDAQNAFAEGFGYYLWAAVSGSSQAIDGKNANNATTYDLETPAITSKKGPDVAGCVAGALYDLRDAANESIDTVDGTSAPERVLLAAATVTVAPKYDTFLQAWANAGYDAPGITRVFIGDALLSDDTLEPNDAVAESFSLGGVGVVRKALILNRFNEDWYAVTLAADASALMADAKYDPLTTGATVGLEIRSAAGALLATGTPNSGTGAIHAVTAALPAGSYRVGVRHLSGGTVPTYDFQVYVPPTMDASPVKDWTVGQHYDQGLGVADGVGPYFVTTPSGSLPPGLAIDSPTVRAFGSPSMVGTFPVTVQLTDSGSPANIVQRSETVTIHDVLKIAVAPFVGFALGKSVDTTLPTSGGTQPFTLGMTTGALPGALAFDPNSLHVTGLAAAAPSTALELDGVDFAGSADHIATRAVIANPSSGKNVPADLVAGTDACGWWFDAVEGSTVSFTATTAKKRAKRTLSGVVLAPDRSVVLTGKIKAKPGSLTGTKVVCPLSGRYYVIASSDSGDATQLLGNVHVAPPKGGSVKPVVFDPKDTTTIEVGALPGATLTFKFAGDKKAGLTAKIFSITDPSGALQVFTSFVKPSATGGMLTMPLPAGGTWTIVLGATSTNGTSGKLSSSYTVKQPKGAAYSTD